MTDRELMQQALDALAQSWVNDHHGNRKQVLAMCADDFEKPFRAMLALRRRLSQCERCGKASPAEIHTCTPIDPLLEALRVPEKKREWVGLTDEEAREICVKNVPYVIDMVAALEAKLKEKNNG